MKNLNAGDSSAGSASNPNPDLSSNTETHVVHVVSPNSHSVKEPEVKDKSSYLCMCAMI